MNKIRNSVRLLVLTCSVLPLLSACETREEVEAKRATEQKEAAERAEAEFAAQEAAKLPPPPTCKRELKNGERLAGNLGKGGDGHAIEIDNGTKGDAIIKIRHSPSNRLAVSMVVKQNQKVTLKGVPDGSYRIQYAFGDAFAENCKSFTVVRDAAEFPGVEQLTTTREPTYNGTMIGHSQLSYTLYEVSGGNVQPNNIDAASFNAD